MATPEGMKKKEVGNDVRDIKDTVASDQKSNGELSLAVSWLLS